MRGRVSYPKLERGFTVTEMLVVLGLVGVLSAIAVINLNALSSPAENGAAELLGFFKQARARAIATTSAYFITPSSGTEISTSSGVNCSDPSPVPDSTLELVLPTGASLPDTSWTVCFTSRGLSDGNIAVVVNDIHGGARTVEILLGGSIRIQGV